MPTTPARGINPLPETDNVTAGPWGDDGQRSTELSTTIKAASTTGAPWVIAKASDAPTLAKLIHPEDMVPVIDAVVDNQVYFEEKYRASTTNAPAAAPAATKDSAPSGQTRSCKHGEMQFRSGSSNGRAWQAFMCPTPKGTADQCPPEWVK